MPVRPIFAAFLALSASPAAADITARYVSGRNAALAMTIEVNDRGDSRASTGNQMAVVTRNGETYVLMADLVGPFAVRQEDMLAVFAAQARAMMPATAGPPPERAPQDRPVAVAQGTEEVAGRTGTVWTIRSPREAGAARQGRGPRRERDGALDFVVSADSDLAPVGRVLARQFGASVDAMNEVTGIGAGDYFGAAVRSVFGRGTVIRFGRLLRLESVVTGPVPADRFALPETILSRDQYAGRIGMPAPR